MQNKFLGSEIGIMLMTEQGQFIDGGSGGSQLLNFALCLDNGVLKAGNYIILVSPYFNAYAEDSPDYKKLLVDIYAPHSVKISKIDNIKGMQIAEKTFRNLAGSA